MKENIIIATLKTWNLKNYKKLKKLYQDFDFILVKNEQELNALDLAKLNPKFIFFPHWSFKIKEDLFLNYECVVFHMSALPFARGGSPLQNLISRGVKKTKISAIKACKDLDAGDIYMKKKLDLSKKSAEKIYKKASKIIFFKMIAFMLKNTCKPKAQQGKATYFKRRTKEESNLNLILENSSLEQIFDFIRMLDAPSYPKAFLEFKRVKMEFEKVSLKKTKLKGRFKLYEK